MSHLSTNIEMWTDELNECIVCIFVLTVFTHIISTQSVQRPLKPFCAIHWCTLLCIYEGTIDVVLMLKFSYCTKVSYLGFYPVFVYESTHNRIIQTNCSGSIKHRQCQWNINVLMQNVQWTHGPMQMP